MMVQDAWPHAWVPVCLKSETGGRHLIGAISSLYIQSSVPCTKVKVGLVFSSILYCLSLAMIKHLQESALTEQMRWVDCPASGKDNNQSCHSSDMQSSSEARVRDQKSHPFCFILHAICMYWSHLGGWCFSQSGDVVSCLTHLIVTFLDYLPL